MCGILGIASTKEESEKEWLFEGSKLLEHRGPDESGNWWSKCYKVGLFHRRLSIIDLSENGKQPFVNNILGLSLIYNGEIYNYRELRKYLSSKGHQFKSNSDTEVIIFAFKEWGNLFLEKLNGAFSLGLYDIKNSKLILARDRAGEKPLFYYLSNGTIIFSSELKAILSNTRLPREIDHMALNSYLSFGYSMNNQCILKGYKQLEPGKMLIFDTQNGSVNIDSYWQLPSFNPENADLDIITKLNKLENILEDAVVKQMHADVPVGILLSGGIDSSLITAFASRNFENVNTFNIGFDKNIKVDESRVASELSNYFGTNHTEFIANPDCVELLPLLAKQFDEPIIDSSMIPTYLVYKLISKQAKVAISGDGGDELFGGYKHYSRFLIMSKFLKFFPRFLKHFIEKQTPKFLDNGYSLYNYLSSINTNFDTSLPNIPCYFPNQLRNKLFKEDFSFEFEDINKFNKSSYFDEDVLQKATRNDFYNYLSRDILTKVDRTSMLNSVEARAPFLDYRVIEFAFSSISSDLKANTKNTKIILRKLAEKLLPPKISKLKKKGFELPLNLWLESGPFRDFFYDVLSSSNSIISKEILMKLFKNIKSKKNNPERLFALVQLQLWKDIYNIKF